MNMEVQLYAVSKCGSDTDALWGHTFEHPSSVTLQVKHVGHTWAYISKTMTQKGVMWCNRSTIYQSKSSHLIEV